MQHLVGDNLFGEFDEPDAALVASGTWHTHKTGRRTYVMGRLPGSRKKIYLHRLLMGFPAGLVDHRDGNGLNNRRENLRVAAGHRQNAQGFQRKRIGATSRFRGVSWDASRNKWAVKIKAGGKNLSAGRFDSEEAAARSYNLAAIEHFGSFAHLNTF